MESALKKAARAAAQTMAITGFRSAKVPYRALERYVGRSALLADVQKELAGQVLDGFLEDNSLGELGYRELENIQDDPVTYTFRFVLVPYVQLGDYSVLRVDTRNLEFPEEHRMQAMTDVLEKFTEFQQVEEATDWKDWVILDAERHLTREAALEQENWALTLSKDDALHPSFLQEKFIGMVPCQERSFDMVCSAEGLVGYSGKLMRFELKLKSVVRRQRPA